MPPVGRSASQSFLDEYAISSDSTLIDHGMFDGKRERVNELVRKILQLPPEDHSVDFTRATGQIAEI
jgi:hypothetical protein